MSPSSLAIVGGDVCTGGGLRWADVLMEGDRVSRVDLGWAPEPGGRSGARWWRPPGSAAEKSKSASRHGEGRQANRARLAWRRATAAPGG